MGPPEGRPAAPRAIVGIGASAGGLEAFTAFLEAMPADSGAAFVLVAHLDPHHESMMASLLAKHTAMPVAEAEHGARLEANHVYVIPPNTYIALHDGSVVHDPLVRRDGISMPINHFFRSLAGVCGERAIGIVLSGTGSDGAAGLKEIKCAGGVTIVQQPETAAYDGMPRAALAAGAADFVLPVEKMPEALLNYLGRAAEAAHQDTADVIKPDHLRPVIDILRFQTGVDFLSYKKGTLIRRVHRRMGLRQAATLADYTQLLRDDRCEVQNLFKDLLIGITAFFREPEAWAALEREVIAPLVRGKSSADSIRVWVPGCATGEEAYTLAILLHEQMEAQRRNIKLEIFATDLDQEAVKAARNGLYPESVAAEAGEARLRRFFSREDGHYRVNKSLRESVVCAPHNLLSDPPFSKLDLISCRNALMYFEPGAQRRLIELFHFALREGGYLFLGKSESLSGGAKLFEPAAKEARLFRRLDTAPPFRGPFLMPAGERPAKEPAGFAPLNVRDATGVEAAKRLLLERYAPASAVIDQRHNAQFFHGKLNNYLHFPQGEPTTNIIEMALPGLRPKLRVALRKASGESQPVTAIAQKVERNGGTVSVRIAVEPIPHHGRDKLLLVSFTDLDTNRQRARPASLPGGRTAPARAARQEDKLRQLEDELQATRSDLQLTIKELELANEELKASNEEVMAMNEELQSANEELESSREELQSLNEELSTVNAQLEGKLAELETTNNDLVNLLTSTRIATLFLGLDLKIRRFTPSCTEHLGLIESDIGRPVGDFSLRIADPDLAPDAQSVIEKLEPVEAQVQSARGLWFLRRILPYRAAGNKIDGAVVTYTNITPLKLAAQEVEARERRSKAVVALGQTALTESDPQILLDQAAKTAAGQLACDFSEIMAVLPGRDSLILRAGLGWKEGSAERITSAAGIESLAGYTLQSGGPVIVNDFAKEKRFNLSALSREHGAVSGAGVVIGPEDRRWGALGVLSSKTRQFTVDEVNFLQSVANLLWAAIARSIAEEEVRDSRAQLAAMLNTAEDAIVSHDSDMKICLFNRAAERIFGYEAEEILGRPLDILIPRRFQESHRAHVRTFCAGTLDSRPMSARRPVFALRKDGSEFPAEASISKVRTASGVIATAILQDITVRKKHEEQLRHLLGEVNHRTKNVLAVVQAIASQTAASDPEEFRQRFSERLASLSASQDLLVEAEWKGVDLEALARVQLAPFAGPAEGRIALHGPALRVSSSAAQAIGMALHELATNAAKYGALSTAAGRIAISWGFRRDRDVDGRLFTLSWTEAGGPPVEKPLRSGFGRLVIEAMPQAQLDATVTLDFPPTGLQWRLECPANMVLEPAGI